MALPAPCTCANQPGLCTFGGIRSVFTFSCYIDGMDYQHHEAQEVVFPSGPQWEQSTINARMVSVSLKLISL